MSSRAVLVTALVLFSALPYAPTLAHATHPAACPDGRYVVEGRSLLPSLLPVQDAVVIDHGTVAIESGCGAVPARIRRVPSGFLLRASWLQCGTVRRVRLAARITEGCALMRGIVATSRPRSLRPFVARQCTGPACPPRTCGSNTECRPSEYCAKDAGRCDTDDLGQCSTRPDVCPLNVDPVCGCDGHTYGNACEAAASGVNVRQRGRCETTCGGITGLPCSADQFCELPAATCDTADLLGQCVAVPGGCPDVYLPVCGCDGVTYGNDCERQAAMAQKAHGGRCDCVEAAGPPGFKAVDHDGDGCADKCRATCDTHCDCYQNPALSFSTPCPLLCPTCGGFWTCEQNLCTEHCGPVPPQAACPH